MLKEVIIFAAGAGFGILGTYLFLDKKYAKRTEDEVASMKEYLEKSRSAVLASEYVTPEEAGVEKEDVSTNISMLRKGEAVYKPGRLAGTEDIDYSNIGSDRAESEYPMDDSEYEHYANIGEMRGSQVIEADEVDEIPQYDKVILQYYTYNNILVYGEPENEEQEVIEDEDGLLGDAWEKSGFMNIDDDRDTLYIRNFDRGTDYEIQKIFSAYQMT